VEVGAYWAGIRALYDEELMIHKSIFVFNLILFYFGISVLMITTLSETHRAPMTHYPTCRVVRIPMVMLVYCDASVGLCALHLMYEIHHHYSPLVMTMYTYVHQYKLIDIDVYVCASRKERPRGAFAHPG
jgi:hypothetical protein